MPSRKKAQGKARKAKQTAEASNNINANNSACNHIGEWNWSDDDYDAVNSLLGEYSCKYYELARGGDKDVGEICSWAYNTYDKYHQLGDAIGRSCSENYYWQRGQQAVLMQPKRKI